MGKRRYIKQEWRKNWKYLQEGLPITTGWVTDGVSDDITNKEVTEEIMGLLDKAREEVMFTEDEQRVLRFALKLQRDDIHKVWDEETFDSIWKKVGGLSKLITK